MINWLYPAHVMPPHAVTTPAKVASLMKDFEEFGWWGEALVGYVTYDKRSREYAVQLLSGSHRWAAALKLGIRIPVYVVPEEDVDDAWGDLDKWSKLMQLGHSAELSVRF